MAIKSKARHDLTLRSIKRELAAGRDVAYWLDKAYNHYDNGLLDEADIAEVEALAQAYYDALDAEATEDVMDGDGGKDGTEAADAAGDAEAAGGLPSSAAAAAPLPLRPTATSPVSGESVPTGEGLGDDAESADES